MNNSKKGFTIVELVIVIAIIAILAAILIPSFAGLIQDGKDAAALADARVIYSEYIATNDEVDDPVYVKVTQDNTAVYFKVENGQLSDEKYTAVPADETIIYKDDSGSISTEVATATP